MCPVPGFSGAWSSNSKFQPKAGTILQAFDRRVYPQNRSVLTIEFILTVLFTVITLPSEKGKGNFLPLKLFNENFIPAHGSIKSLTGTPLHNLYTTTPQRAQWKGLN